MELAAADTIKIVELFITAIAIIVVVYILIGAIRSGTLKRIRLGSIEIQGSAKEKEEAESLITSISRSVTGEIPFETGQLANYYAQVLVQSKTSFWFSLVFASIGFLIIVLAAFIHSDSQSGSTIARFVAGGVVDAVAGLFFVQSRRAQESMAAFFDKLRRDRNHVEARKLCEDIDTPSARDALRVQLSLHYAEVQNPDSVAENIIRACLEEKKG